LKGEGSASGRAPPFPPGKSANPGGKPKDPAKTRSGKFKQLLADFEEARKKGVKLITPLEYLQMVLFDPHASKTQKMYAASAAAPYIHHKLPQRIPQEDPNDVFAKVREMMRQAAERSCAPPPPAVEVSTKDKK
jgi:hypothetical protein